MERKVGKQFDFLGVKLKVVKSNKNCEGCYFDGYIACNKPYDSTIGPCVKVYRKDFTQVIFKKVKE